jgi:D-alanyl-D-alanine carboxypeptidase
VLKQFIGPQFKELARSVKYPNTQLFDEPPAITGNPVADARIRSIAQARGYVLTSMPVTSIEKINEPRLESDDLLQPLAAIAWRELKAAAARDGIPLSLLSAYRSPQYQRDLFMSRLKGATVAQIAAGQGDAAVNTTLGVTAVPGYSRHHTGYTIDLWCEDGSGKFLASRCYTWISANNYKVAKQTGWIPSYPDGVDMQGPEPEPWEYVWVGKDLVTD